MHRPITIPGTRRQSVTCADGTKLQRKYVYLPESAWHALQRFARATDTSVSQLIKSFADHGIATLKESNDSLSIPRQQ
jgi:predicted DNA-binding ribbon-helix-helix protein